MERHPELMHYLLFINHGGQQDESKNSTKTWSTLMVSTICMSNSKQQSRRTKEENVAMKADKR